MSARKPPRLFRSGLTGRIYITTSYKELGNGRVVSNTKFDATADFEAIEAERAAERDEDDPDDVDWNVATSEHLSARPGQP